jgi:hypothetical protein
LAGARRGTIDRAAGLFDSKRVSSTKPPPPPHPLEPDGSKEAIDATRPFQPAPPTVPMQVPDLEAAASSVDEIVSLSPEDLEPCESMPDGFEPGGAGAAHRDRDASEAPEPVSGAAGSLAPADKNAAERADRADEDRAADSASETGDHDSSSGAANPPRPPDATAESPAVRSISFASIDAGGGDHEPVALEPARDVVAPDPEAAESPPPDRVEPDTVEPDRAAAGPPLAEPTPTAALPAPASAPSSAAASGLDPELTDPSGRIGARMRFEAPEKFLEFYEKQLSKRVVGLRHGEALVPGTEIDVYVGPPGAPDRLKLPGEVKRSTHRGDGSHRLRVAVRLTETDEAWLGAYVTALRVARERMTTAPEPARPPARPKPPLPERDQVLALAGRLPTLTYYQLLDVPVDAEPAAIQRSHHELTRRYHPDIFFGGDDPVLRRAAGVVYRRMSEAYGVLRDPRRRALYDEGLQGAPHTWVLRLSEDAEQRVQRRGRMRRGATDAGHFYWTRARAILEEAKRVDDDRKSRRAMEEAARLLRLALAFEPQNEHFGFALEHISDRLALQS